MRWEWERAASFPALLGAAVWAERAVARRVVAGCAVVFMAGAVTMPAAYAQLPQMQPPETQTVYDASRVLQELSGLRVQQIPQSLLGSAEAVAIVPGMVRGAFVVGIQRGRGVLAVKDEAGAWTAPQFITITGGSIGWQAGIQATDLVLVFSSRRSVENLLQGKLTVGVDASAAAGPVGRRASAATDLPMQAEIYSYSRSRGLFAGVSLDGSALQMDPLATGNYYASVAPGTVPPTAQQLLAQLEAFSPTRPSLGIPLGPAASQQGQPIYPDYPSANASGVNRGRDPFPPGGVPAAGASIAQGRLPGSPGQAAGANAALDRAAADLAAAGRAAAGRAAADDAAAAVRAQLVAALPRLDALLDSQWRAYLRVPDEILRPTGDMGSAALRDALARYDAVAADGRYAGLNQRSEFQVVRQLLQRLAAISATTQPLQLPPPPSGG